VLETIAEVGIGPQVLKELVAREGTRKLACPTCGGLLTSVTVRRERLHACTPCTAVWLDDGALQRLSPRPVPGSPTVSDAASFAAPDPLLVVGRPVEVSAATPVELSSSAHAAATADAAAAWRPGAATPSNAAENAPADAGAHRAHHALRETIPEPAFQPAVSAFKEDDGTWFKRLLLVGFALVVVGGFYLIVSNAFAEGHPVALGGGARVLFWEHPIEESTLTSPIGALKRFSSPSKTNVLEAAYLAGAGGEPQSVTKRGSPEAALSTLYGRWCQLTSVPSGRRNGFWAIEAECVIEDRQAIQLILATVYFNNRDLWVVAAKSNGALFAKSAIAISFRDGFAKVDPGNGQERSTTLGGEMQPD
jgi:Zn-finger nucleic acid-binding protein